MQRTRRYWSAIPLLAVACHIGVRQNTEPSRVMEPSTVFTNQRGDSAGPLFTIVIRLAHRPSYPILQAQYAVLVRSGDSVRYHDADVAVDSTGRHTKAYLPPGVYELFIRSVYAQPMQVRVRVRARCASTLEVYMTQACTMHPCLSEQAPARAIYSTCEGD